MRHASSGRSAVLSAQLVTQLRAALAMLTYVDSLPRASQRPATLSANILLSRKRADGPKLRIDPIITPVPSAHSSPGSNPHRANERTLPSSSDCKGRSVL